MEKKEIFTMEVKRSLSGREKFAYGIGAVGKDMVYMLSASYISIYFLDVMGISAAAIAVLLMAARVPPAERSFPRPGSCGHPLDTAGRPPGQLHRQRADAGADLQHAG